ncbi:olfactory receptor 2T27-like [Tachyglossus aculeatus]|uniref:olfactory receptor 2T27-like n=1 Tax=Tachyglossus aculeatus TaxID=9261 RepID=UPI0018F67615|nr:olfactory receptor 2T27-like [Tachyglossus aculeatus]
MAKENRTSSTDFILLGLFQDADSPKLLFSLVFIAFCTALVGNVTMMVLIHTDPRLRTPMYFLLSQLSTMDLLYISSIVPKMAADFLSGKKAISFGACAAQMFIYLTLAGSECFLLALMSYDRYVAILHPLRYPVLMNGRVCVLMTLGSWLLGALDGLLLTPITMTFPFCRSREIRHFFCEVPAVQRLSCADTSLYETAMTVCCSVMLLVPFTVIAVSYGLILSTVLRMKSSQGRRKASATCSSHLMVVGLYYGAAIFTYMQPGSLRSPGQDKAISVFYTIITPMLNPFIYSLRNKEVARALRRGLRRCAFSPRMGKIGVSKDVVRKAGNADKDARKEDKGRKINDPFGKKKKDTATFWASEVREQSPLREYPDPLWPEPIKEATVSLLIQADSLCDSQPQEA